MTQIQIKYLLLFQLIIFSVSSQKNTIFNQQNYACSNDDNENQNGVVHENSKEATLTYLDEQFTKFKFAKQRDIIMIVGNTGAAQKILSLLVTEAEINGVEISPGEFSFVDKYGIIEEDLAPLVPTSIHDPKSGLEFYTCALNNVTEMKYDIATSFFLHRVLKFSDRVKIVFTADHSLFVDYDTSDQRRGLREFIAAGATFLKDIYFEKERFKDAIGLVVTNVKGRVTTPDYQEISWISIALNLARDDFLCSNYECNPDDFKNEVMLIAILVARISMDYRRIGILRHANRTGSISEMQEMQAERKRISFIMNPITIKYIEANESYFDYPISNNTKDRIPELIETLQIRLTDDLTDIGIEIKTYYLQQEKGPDISILYDKISLGHQHISQLSSTEIDLFGKELIKAINTLGIEIKADKLTPLLNHIELAQFFDVVISSSSLYTVNGLQGIKNYLYESKIWYEFTIALHDVLSKYSVQQNTTQYQYDVLKLLVQFSINENWEMNIDNTDLKEFLDHIGSDIYSKVQNMTVNSYKLNAVKTVLSHTLNSNIVSTCSPTKLEVKGYIVKMSDVFQMKCLHKVNIVNVFALSKVIVDADIEGKEFTIIAPTWDFDQRYASSHHLSLLEMPESNIEESCEEVIKYIKSSYSLNAYKEFVREHLANYIWETVLRKFLNTLTENRCIKSLYDTAGFIDELLSMENKYFQLRNEISFVPFFQSLQKRVIEYTKVNTEDNKILLLLCTAILSKLNAIDNQKQRISVINMLDHFELLKGNIYALRNIESQLSVLDYQNKYKISLDNKIKSIIELVRVHIRQELEETNFKIKTEIPNLVEEVILIFEPIRTIEQYHEVVDKQGKLENILRLHQMLGTASIINEFVKFFVSAATAIVDTMNGDVLMAKAFVENKNYVKNHLYSFALSLKFLIFEMQKPLRKEHVLFLEQLKYIKSEADEECDKQGVIKNKVVELMDTVKEELSTNDILDPTIIYQMRSDLAKVLKENAVPNVDKCLNMTRINNVSSMDLDVYNQIRNNLTTPRIANVIDNTAERQINWRRNEINIYKMITIKSKEIQNDVEYILQSVTNNSYIDFSFLKKWDIPKTLQNFRLVLSRIILRNVAPEIIDNSIAELIEVLSILVDIYSRIGSYEENARFAAYYLKTLSPGTVDETMNNVSNLNLIIRSNRVLEQYEIALHIWQAYQFPFSYTSNAMLKLFADINFENIETLIKITTNNINYLKTQVEHIETSVNEYDDKIFENKANTNILYTWTGRETERHINKLLQGEEVIFIAETNDEFPQNAVKFNEIGLQFEITNNSVQLELESELEKFRVTITMAGCSYYRCGMRTYFFSIDKNIEISYNFKRNSMPIETNKIYKLIDTEGYFFSPYTMYKIKLTKLGNSPADTVDDFEKLKSFMNAAIDLKLIGRAQYLKDQSTHLYDVCNDRLDHFYNFDNVTSSAIKLETLEYVYSL